MKTVFVAAFILVSAIAASSQSKVIVRFARGSHSASIKGTITGYKYVDYILGARAGQNMTVELTSTGDKAQFVILDPDKENVEYGTGATEYSDGLEKTGNYTVRVLMSRAEARRRGAKTSYAITFTIQ